jgi:uncharacterized protein
VRSRKGTLTLRREDGRIVCERVLVADTTGRRMRGLLGRRRLPVGEGLLLRPAWSIHTAFMQFPIDVVFVDHDQVVIRIRPSLKPFKTASCRGAREVVELAAGECERRGLDVGDRVAWASQTGDDESPLTVPAASRGLGAVPDGIILATADPRFAKVAEFIVAGRDIGGCTRVKPDDLAGMLERTKAQALLLDAGDDLAQALRLSNTIRSRRPDVSIVIVGDAAADRSPQELVVYDKWEQLDEAIDALMFTIQGARA